MNVFLFFFTFVNSAVAGELLFKSSSYYMFSAQSIWLSSLLKQFIGPVLWPSLDVVLLIKGNAGYDHNYLDDCNSIFDEISSDLEKSWVLYVLGAQVKYLRTPKSG